MEPIDEQQIQASLRDPTAFGGVFERHHAVIWRYLARSAGREAADELAGEVFLIAFRRRDRFDPSRGTARSWLYGIAANLLRERLRRGERSRRAVVRLAGRREAGAAVVGADEASELNDDSEAALVLSCLAGLGAPDREVLELFAWEGLSYDEIAAALAVPVGTVRSRLSRARARLRSSLELAGVIDQLPATTQRGRD